MGWSAPQLSLVRTIPASSPEVPLLAHPVQTAAGSGWGFALRPSDPVSHTHNTRASSTALPVKVQALSPDRCRDIRGKEKDQLCCSNALRTGSPALPTTGSALACCPGKLPGVLQGVRHRDSSLTLGTPGRETFLSTAGSKGWRGRACLPRLRQCMADMRVGGSVRSPALPASGSTHLSSHCKFSSSVLSR